MSILFYGGRSKKTSERKKSKYMRAMVSFLFDLALFTYVSSTLDMIIVVI